MPSEREVHGDRVRMRRAVLRASVARSEARRPVLYSELSQGDIHPRVRRDEEIPPLFLAELFRGGVQSYGVKVATLGIAMAIAASPQVGCGLREVVDEPPNEPAVEKKVEHTYSFWPNPNTPVKECVGEHRSFLDYYDNMRESARDEFLAALAKLPKKTVHMEDEDGGPRLEDGPEIKKKAVELVTAGMALRDKPTLGYHSRERDLTRELVQGLIGHKRSYALAEARNQLLDLSAPEMGNLVRELARFLETPNEDEVFTAARFLQFMGDSAVGTLMNLAGDTTRSDRARYAAVYALGKSIGSGEVNPISFASAKEDVLKLFTGIAESNAAHVVRGAAVDAAAGMIGYLTPDERARLREKLVGMGDDESQVAEKAKDAVGKIDAMKLGEKPLTPESFPSEIEGIEGIEWKQVVENPEKTVIHIKEIHSLQDLDDEFKRQHWINMEEGFGSGEGSEELWKMGWLILDAKSHVQRTRSNAHDAIGDLARQGVGAVGIEGLVPADMQMFERRRDEFMSPARPKDLTPGKVAQEAGPGYMAEYTDPNVDAFPADDEYTNRVRGMLDSGEMRAPSKEFEEAEAERRRRATKVVLSRKDPNVIIYYGGAHDFASEVEGNVNLVELTPEGYARAIERMDRGAAYAKEHNMPPLRIPMLP